MSPKKAGRILQLAEEMKNKRMGKPPAPKFTTNPPTTTIMVISDTVSNASTTTVSAVTTTSTTTITSAAAATPNKTKTTATSTTTTTKNSTTNTITASTTHAIVTTHKSSSRTTDTSNIPRNSSSLTVKMSSEIDLFDKHSKDTTPSKVAFAPHTPTKSSERGKQPTNETAEFGNLSYRTDSSSKEDADTVPSSDVFAVFPKKTYKTVSVYTLEDQPTSELEMRERRDLASRVPSISIKRQRERMELDRLANRVNAVLKLESELARIAVKYNDRESQGSWILGSLVQTLVLVRNTDQLPVLLTKFADELEMVLSQATEETLSDLLLWSTVLHWWNQLVEGQEACAELVYGTNKEELQKSHLARFVKQSSWTDSVRRAIEEEGWAEEEMWKLMERALAPKPKDGQSGISKNLPLLENLFLLEEKGLSKKASDVCKTHSCDELLNLNPHPKGSLLAKVQDLYKLFKVHLHFALGDIQEDQLKVMSSKLEAPSGDKKDLVSTLAALLTSMTGAEEFEERPDVIAALLLKTTCHGDDDLPQINKKLFNILQIHIACE